jgi:hypothetical protein
MVTPCRFVRSCGRHPVVRRKLMLEILRIGAMFGARIGGTFRSSER